MLEELKRALSAHDWYHEMSDDSGVFRAGRADKHRMLNLIGRAIDTHGDAARKIVKDFYIMKQIHAHAQFNPYDILKHYL